MSEIKLFGYLPVDENVIFESADSVLSAIMINFIVTHNPIVDFVGQKNITYYNTELNAIEHGNDFDVYVSKTVAELTIKVVSDARKSTNKKLVLEFVMLTNKWNVQISVSAFIDTRNLES